MSRGFFLFHSPSNRLSPLSMLKVVETWHEGHSFKIDEGFYVSILDCMGPNTVFPR